MRDTPAIGVMEEERRREPEVFDPMSTGAAIGVGAVAGLIVGIVVSVTDLHLAPRRGWSSVPWRAGSPGGIDSHSVLGGG